MLWALNVSDPTEVKVRCALCMLLASGHGHCCPPSHLCPCVFHSFVQPTMSPSGCTNPGRPSCLQPAHVIGSRSSSCVFIPLAFSGGRRFFVTVLGLSVVQLVDTSDPWRWKTLQEISLPPGTYPHAATAARWAAGLLPCRISSWLLAASIPRVCCACAGRGCLGCCGQPWWRPIHASSTKHHATCIPSPPLQERHPCRRVGLLH